MIRGSPVVPYHQSQQATVKIIISFLSKYYCNTKTIRPLILMDFRPAMSFQMVIYSSSRFNFNASMKYLF